MGSILKNDWNDILKDEFKKDYYLKLRQFLINEYKTKTIYPNMYDIFNALHYTPYNQVKVVILGQDTYHGVGEANGLAFAVSDGVKLPPSLRNIYKELYNDLGIEPASVGNLECWAKEGVLLLNAVLTVEKDKPASHKALGWENFTDAIIKSLNDKDTPVVFILWGNFARSKKSLITNPKHYVIESTHPSPFSANYGFFGSKPFSKTNEFLKKNHLKEIDWHVD